MLEQICLKNATICCTCHLQYPRCSSEDVTKDLYLARPGACYIMLSFSLFASTDNSNVAYYLSVAVEGDEGERKSRPELEFVARRVEEGLVGWKWKREEMNLLGDKYAQL